MMCAVGERLGGRGRGRGRGEGGGEGEGEREREGGEERESLRKFKTAHLIS